MRTLAVPHSKRLNWANSGPFMLWRTRALRVDSGLPQCSKSGHTAGRSRVGASLQRIQPRATDSTAAHAHTPGMDEETCEDMLADERFLLGLIAGLCNREPRNELRLETLLTLLRHAQQERCFVTVRDDSR